MFAILLYIFFFSHFILKKKFIFMIIFNKSFKNWYNNSITKLLYFQFNETFILFLLNKTTE